MQQLPISSYGNQSFVVNLNSQPIRIQLRWQSPDNAWYISLMKAEDNTPYLINRRLIINVPLFANVTTSFNGDIVVISKVTPYANLQRDSFQNDYAMYYLTPEELSALQ